LGLDSQPPRHKALTGRDVILFRSTTLSFVVPSGMPYLGAKRDSFQRRFGCLSIHKSPFVHEVVVVHHRMKWEAAPIIVAIFSSLSK
jgi:hypothetical protein